ncbi:MAG: hypothetical protein IPG87_12865 [Saprospiraceae bacterium]|nr:hypothetical protein [Candidatus Vicinibacter affinis]
MWNLKPSLQDVNSSNFGFKFQVKNVGSTEVKLNLDRVRLVIYYQAMPAMCMKDCSFFYVDPVKNATQYHWKIPTGAEVISNEVNQSYRIEHRTVAIRNTRSVCANRIRGRAF